MTSVNELKSRTAKLPPIDNDVQLPAAIRAASLRASELHNSVYQEPEAKEEPVKQGAQDGSDAKAGGGEEKTTPAENREDAPAGREEAAPATPESWEHKYNSLKGRYDQQEDTIRGLNQRLEQMRALVASMETSKARNEQPPSETQFGKLTDKDREDFGEDFLDAASRAAEEKLGPYISKLEGMVRQLGGSVQSVADTTAKNAQQNMYAYLDDELPNWRNVNRDQKFIAWCNLQDPYSGAIRMDMLKDAYQKSDAVRVLRFFKGFLSDEAASDPVNRGKPETPAVNRTPGKVPLSEFAAPGRAKAPAATDVPGEKETITRAQIAAFYRDVNKGKYRGNEAEKNRLEAEIFKAEAEGRVV